MANFVGAIEQFNPYIQQIPTEAYTKVGMFKEQQYQAGLEKVQSTIDYVAGLDIANEGGRQYLRARVDELTKTLNKYGQSVDFSNPNNVTQLVGLAKPLYQDENIVDDVINTGIYRNYQKQVVEKQKSGQLDPVQQYYEQQEVSKWLNSDSAGATYTGRQAPNSSTYEQINKKVLDFKSKLKPDIRYTEGSTFIYGTKSYNTSQLSELFYNQVLDGDDREVLMHNTMYNDSLRYNLNPNSPKDDLIGMYTAKKTNNELNLKKINLQLDQFKDHDDPDYQSLVRDRDILSSNISLYDKAIKTFQKTDPLDESQKKGIYSNISAEQYKDSLSAIFEFEQEKPEYRKDVEQSRDHKNATLNAAIAKGTVAYTQLKDENGQPMWDENGSPVMGIRAVLDEDNDPTILEDPNKQKGGMVQTGVDANGNPIWSQSTGTGKTKKANPLINLLQGTPGESAAYSVAGTDDIVHIDKNILADQYNSLDGNIQQNMLAMSQAMERASTSGFKLSDYYTIEQVPGPDGKDVAAIRWASADKKKEFMQYMDMMNSAYEIEAADGNQANKSFMRYINGELDATSEELGLKGVKPEVVQDLMKLKGNAPILSMMDEVFKDKAVAKNLIEIDKAIAQKKDLADSWRKVLYNNVKDNKDRAILDKMTDQDIMGLQTANDRDVAGFFNINKQTADKLKSTPFTVKWTPNGDGTYTATAYLGYGGDGKPIPSGIISRSVPKSVVENRKEGSDKLRKQYSKYTQGLNPGEEITVMGRSAEELVSNSKLFESLSGGLSNPFGLNNATIQAANNQLKTQYSVMRQNITRSVSLLGLPENKQEKESIIQSITNSLIGQGGSKILTDPNFIQSDQDDIKSITSVTDITGASTKSVGNFFNNSGFINIKFKYQDKDGKEKEGTAAYNIDRILATDPDFASKYSKYFAALKYAKEGAAIRIKSYIDPNSGYESYSGQDTGVTISPTGSRFSDKEGAIGKEFSRHIIQSGDGHEIPINYRIVSYGNAAPIGNRLNKTNIDNGKYAVQLQINTPSGKKNIFVKSLNGNILQYNTPEEALYQLKDELFKGIPADHPGDFVKKADGTKVPNYFIEFNQNKPSLRGFFNTQMKLNGEKLPTLEEIKKAYADIVVGNSSEIDKELLKFTPTY